MNGREAAVNEELSSEKDREERKEEAAKANESFFLSLSLVLIFSLQIIHVNE
jgi:hypothetical protein